MVITYREKAEVLSFNYSVPPLDPDLCHHSLVLLMSFQMIFCVVWKRYIEHLLASVDPSKASGANLLSAKMLKATATRITPAIYYINEKFFKLESGI